MSAGAILSRTAGALSFAACIGVAWMLLRLARLGLQMDVRAELRQLMTVMYLAALTEIVALRLGLPRNTQSVNFTPLESTLGVLGNGAWPFAYHVIGNMIWFVPLGWLGRRMWPSNKPWQMALAGAVVSAGLEALQWLLHSGVTDVDDVLLNALGTLLGALLPQHIQKRKP